MRLSAILLSDSCMNFLSLSSKSMFPLVDAAGGAGVRAGFFALRLRFPAARVLSGFGGSSALYGEVDTPSSLIPMTLTFTVWPP